MQNYATFVLNIMWALRMRPRPSFRDFSMEYCKDSVEEYLETYPQPIAKLFFKNEGAIVHKWGHYLPIYEDIFSKYVGKSVRFLEIGVSKGGSLKMWRRYLGEAAILFGVDIDPGCAVHNGNYGQVRIGSQDDDGFLRRVVKEMGGLDVVLDDGSHVAHHQRASYETLFPLLSEGGLYVIEDMHTAYWEHMEGGLRRRGTAIEFLKDKVDEMHKHYYKRGANTEADMPEIESVQFFDSIAVVVKRKQAPRWHMRVPTRK